MIVETVGIGMLVGLFIGYIVLHVGIGLTLKKQQEELIKTPTNEELTKQVKILTIVNKWFAAIYVIFIIIMLLLL